MESVGNNRLCFLCLINQKASNKSNGRLTAKFVVLKKMCNFAVECFGCYNYIQIQKATGHIHNRYVSQGLLHAKSPFLDQKVHKLKITGVWESISGKYHYVLVLLWY